MAYTKCVGTFSWSKQVFRLMVQASPSRYLDIISHRERKCKSQFSALLWLTKLYKREFHANQFYVICMVLFFKKCEEGNFVYISQCWSILSHISLCDLSYCPSRGGLNPSLSPRHSLNLSPWHFSMPKQLHSEPACPVQLLCRHWVLGGCSLAPGIEMCDADPGLYTPRTRSPKGGHQGTPDFFRGFLIPWKSAMYPTHHGFHANHRTKPWKKFLKDKR